MIQRPLSSMPAGNAQAGPSRPRQKPEIIDLTLSDDEEEAAYAPPPTAKPRNCRATTHITISSTASDIREVDTSRSAMRPSRPSDGGMKGKGKGKEVDRERSTASARPSGGSKLPTSNQSLNRYLDSSHTPGSTSARRETSDAPRRDQTSGAPSGSIPTATDRLMKRQYTISPASARSKQDSVARPAAVSSRVSSQQQSNMGQIPARHPNHSVPQTQRPAAESSKSSAQRQSVFDVRGPPGEMTCDDNRRSSGETSGSALSLATWRRHVEQTQRRSESSKTPHSHSSMPGSNLNSRDVQKQVARPSGSTGKTSRDVQRSAPASSSRPDDTKGMKRSRNDAFESPAKLSRDPNSLPKGRQLGERTSTELGRPSSSTPRTAAIPMRRVDSSTSTLSESGATPTPAARPTPTQSVRQAEGFFAPSKSKPSDSRPRQPSPLKQSSSSFLPSKPLARPAQRIRSPSLSPPTSTPPPPESKVPRPQNPAKSSFPIFSAGYKPPIVQNSPRSATKVKRESSSAVPSSAQKSKPTSDPNTEARAALRHVKREAEIEDDIPSRPKRARPATGAYTVPGMDAAEWPTSSGTTGGQRKKRKSNDAEGSKHVSASTTKPRSEHGTDRNEARTAASSSTQLSAISGTPKVARPGIPSRSSRSSMVPSGSSEPRRSSATPMRSGILTPHQPNYRLPTIATPKSGRMATQTPVTASRSSQKSRFTTPTPRRVRPATLTPKHDNDGPDEAEESVEVPDPIHAHDGDDEDTEFDVLAEFANYQFAPISPEQSTAGVAASEHPTPSKVISVIPATPTSAARPPTPSSSRRSKHRAGSNARTPSTKRAPSIPLSPQVRLFAKGATNNLAADILARARAAEEKAREEQDRRDARRARMEALAADSPEEMHRELADISLAPAAEIVGAADKEEEEESQVSRRSTRIRTASLGPGAGNGDTRPRTKDFKIKSKVKVDKHADRFILEQQKEARSRKPGYRIGDAGEVLKALSRSVSPTKGAVQYPTPDSDSNSLESITDSEKEEEEEGEDGEELHDATMNLLENNEDMDGLLGVAREIRGSKRNSARTSVVEDTPVFWEPGFEEQVVRVDIRPEPEYAPDIKSLLALGGSVPHDLLPMLAAAFPLNPSPSQPPSDTTGQALLNAAMGEPELVKRSILHARLIYILDTPSEHPFGSSECLYQSICRIWRSLGARSSLIPASSQEDLPPIEVQPDREEACILICQVILKSTKRRHLSPPDSRCLLIPLLLLAIDPTTSGPLRRTLDDTVNSILPSGLPPVDLQEKAEGLEEQQLSPAEVARSLLDCTAIFSLDIRTKVIAAIGQRSEQARSIAIWYAMGLLLPAGLPAGLGSPSPSTPNIHMLMEGGEALHTAINDPSPPYDQIEKLITCLYTSLSDIETLVQTTPYNSILGDDQHPIKDLRSSIKTMHDKFKPPGDYTLRQRVSRMKARLQQLGVVLDMQFLTAFKRFKVQRDRERLGPGLKLGVNGQSTLAFSRDMTVPNDTEVQ